MTSSRFKLQADINPAITDESFDVAAHGYARVERAAEQPRGKRREAR